MTSVIGNAGVPSSTQSQVGLTAAPATAGGPLPSLTGGGPISMLAGQQASAGGLPTLRNGGPLDAGQTGQTPVTGQPGQAGQTAPATDAAAAPAGLDLNTMLAGTPTFLGPLMAIAGGALALFKPGMLRMMGASMALGGLATTHLVSSAKGRADGIKEFESVITPQIQAGVAQYEDVIKQQQTLIQQLQANGAGSGTGQTGQLPTDGTGQTGQTGQTPTDGTGQTGTGGTDGTGQTGQTPTDGSGTGGTGQTGQTTGPGQTLAPGQWNPAALVGQAVQLAPAKLASGASVAEGGSFILTTPLGDQNGYATFDEANAQSQSTMSTEIMGTKLHRWVVLEHGGRFYAMQAQQDEAGGAPTMPAANGNVVGWHALRFVDIGGGASKWMAYHWGATAGSSFTEFQNGSVSGGGVGGSTAPATTATPTTPAAGAQPAAVGGTGYTQVGVTPATGATVTAGGATTTQPVNVAPAAPVRPAIEGLVGSSFRVNDAVSAGVPARGGFIQLRRLAPLSNGGFATPAEAGDVARQYRAASLDVSEWARWITVRGADNRYYVFEGQLVNKATTALAEGNSPMHVFGHGFAEFFDGKTWQAQAD